MAKINLADKGTIERVTETAVMCTQKSPEDYATAKAMFFKEHEGAIEQVDVEHMERIFHLAYKTVKQQQG